MEKYDKMKASLGKNLPIKKDIIPLDKKHISDDYEYSRKTYKDLIDTGVKSLDVLAELARESEHPRAFEVLSKAIKDIGDTTEKLMKLQQSKKDLEKEDAESHETRKVTNNNMFIGSTTELQRLLSEPVDEKIVINAKNKE